MRHGSGIVGAIFQVPLQPNERSVQGLAQGLRDRHHAAASATVVVQGGVTGDHRGGRVLSSQWNVLIQRCSECKDLESRAGLQPSIGVVVTIGIIAAVVGAHRTGLRLHRNNGSPKASFLVHVDAHGIQRRLLRGGVNSGGNAQAASIDFLFGDAIALELAEHLVLNHCSRTRLRCLLRNRCRIDGVRVGHRSAVSGTEHAHFHHAIEHIVPSRFGLFPVSPGIKRRGALNRGCQYGTLGGGQFADFLAEEGFGGRGDAVGIAAEVDGVEVCLEDFILAPLPSHFGRDHQLPSLARDSTLVAHHGVFHILLRNSGSATSTGVAGNNA